MIEKRISYEDVVKFFAKARFPEQGRPVMSWARMFKVGDTYEIRHGNVVVGIFSPDNKFTFTMNSRNARNSSVTLSQALQRVIPFMWKRKGVGKYAVSPTPQCAEFVNVNINTLKYTYFRDHATWYELFDGLCFDLSTYEPINARPNITAVINHDNRTVWLSSLRKFKRAVKVRAKLGVIDTLIKEVQQERVGIRRYDWEMPDWNTDAWQDMLYTAIKNSECSTELLKGMVKSVLTGYYNTNISTDDVLNECDRVCSNFSVDMRRKFGVFSA